MDGNGLMWAGAEGGSDSDDTVPDANPLCKETRQLTMDALISIQQFKNGNATKQAAREALDGAYEMANLAMADVKDQEDIDEVQNWMTVLAEMEQALNAGGTTAYPRTLLDTIQRTHPDTFATIVLDLFAHWTTEDTNGEAQGVEPLGAHEVMVMRERIREHDWPLDTNPTARPGCSLGLSACLVDTLTNIFNETIDRSQPNELSLVLSVGSGSGLLEAHLQSRWSSAPGYNLRIHGVEVRDRSYTTANRYLPFTARSTVRGTWDISTRVDRARALMFVYPRSTTLIIKYLEEAHHNRLPPQIVVWLGPKSDWSGVFQESLENRPGFGPVEIMQDCGLPEYEMMAVIRRATVAT